MCVLVVPCSCQRIRVILGWNITPIFRKRSSKPWLSSISSFQENILTLTTSSSEIAVPWTSQTLSLNIAILSQTERSFGLEFQLWGSQTFCGMKWSLPWTIMALFLALISPDGFTFALPKAMYIPGVLIQKNRKTAFTTYIWGKVIDTSSYSLWFKYLPLNL